MQTLALEKPQIGDVLGTLFAGYRWDGQRAVIGQPTGYLGQLLGVCALQRHSPTLREIEQACQTDLVLRYGCDVTHLELLAAADGLLAVGFEADIIDVRKGDPVDILTPWRHGIRDWRPLTVLAANVKEMLSFGEWEWEGWQRTVSAMQMLARSPAPVAGAAGGILWQQVCAANIRLAVRAANQ